jgi:hypothetical protein
MATNSYELELETYSRYWFNGGKPLSAISWLAYKLFAVGSLLPCISHIFCLKPLKPVFCNLTSRFPTSLKIKYQRFSAYGRRLNCITFNPCSFSLDNTSKICGVLNVKYCIVLYVHYYFKRQWQEIFTSVFFKQVLTRHMRCTSCRERSWVSLVGAPLRAGACWSCWASGAPGAFYLTPL